MAEAGGSVVDLHQGGRGQVIPQRLVGEKHPLVCRLTLCMHMYMYEHMTVHNNNWNNM